VLQLKPSYNCAGVFGARAVSPHLIQNLSADCTAEISAVESQTLTASAPLQRPSRLAALTVSLQMTLVGQTSSLKGGQGPKHEFQHVLLLLLLYL